MDGQQNRARGPVTDPPPGDKHQEWRRGRAGLSDGRPCPRAQHRWVLCDRLLNENKWLQGE